MAEPKLRFALSCLDLLELQKSGIAGPFPLLADHQVGAVLRKLSIAKAKLFFWHRILSRSLFLTKFFRDARWGKATWHKGMHLVSPTAYALSTNEAILDKIQSILGPNPFSGAPTSSAKSQGDYTAGTSMPIAWNVKA